MGADKQKSIRDIVNKRMSDELKDILKIACCNDMEFFAENICVENYLRRKEVYLEEEFMFAINYYEKEHKTAMFRSDRWRKIIKVGRIRVYPEE